MIFVLHYNIFHLIDRCTRWHAACLVPSKEDHILLDALDTIWVSIHGPMRELIMDGEARLAVSHEAKQYYERHGIRFAPRAKEQQVAHIDRRGALLRDTIHRVSTQCEAEGLNVEFKQILNDCIFMWKCFTLYYLFDTIQCSVRTSTSDVTGHEHAYR